MMKKQFILLGLMALIFAGCSTAPKSSLKGTVTNEELAALYQDLPFEMPKVRIVETPNRRLNIADLGGIPDGVFNNGGIINAAIDSLAAQGGGSVIIPAGLWLSGPVVFQSNINLHIERGALLLFSSDKDLYPLVETSFEGLDTRRCQSPISGRNLENVSITGGGTIDGNGQAWRFVKREKQTESQWKELLNSGGVTNEKGDIWYPSESFKLGMSNVIDQNVPVPPTTEEDWLAIKDFLRPVMISFINCKNLWLDGVTFQNSPAWNVHPLRCENVVISGITVRNPWYSQNGDGLDLESCKNSIVYKSSFDVGDDAICIKSGKDEDGRRHGIPTENLIVSDNVVYHGHGGFVIGSEMSGGVKNVVVRKCLFMGTVAGLRFKSRRGRGGVVENIHIDNINMINIKLDPITFELFYGGKSPLEQMIAQSEGKVAEVTVEPVTVETPVFKDIFITNISSTNSGRAIYFNGLPEMRIANINISNATFLAQKGVAIGEADGLKMTNVVIDAKEGPMLTFFNVTNSVLDNVRSLNPANDTLIIAGADSKNIQLKNMKPDITAAAEGMVVMQ
ncbi:MAG: glycoside hydrolase family 28 protein [Prevotellaceae bacterium]|nr:glycoside hydrolase family 28 protein [Prevotellaceae bacterium]